MSRRHRFRASTARSFLAEARGRPNLEIIAEAQATGLRFDGRRCIGVGYRRHGARAEARARREVIVSGGSINSSHLLQISGVGPAAHLRELGVDVVLDAPGVGANLSDHFGVRVSHRVTDLESINQLSRGTRLVSQVARYVARGDGALTFGVTSAMVFCRSREGLTRPDLQLLFTPASYDLGRFGALERENGMTVAVCPVRPTSRGTIMAKSADPFEAPAIRPNYFSDEDDLRVLRAGFDFTRDIFAAPALARHSGGETEPGADVRGEEDFVAFARARGTPLYHPVGTCRMGEDPGAVVDSRLRVHGLEGLRVIDASVMPEVTTGNTNAPTIMIGERGAAMIREDGAA